MLGAENPLLVLHFCSGLALKNEEVEEAQEIWEFDHFDPGS